MQHVRQTDRSDLPLRAVPDTPPSGRSETLYFFCDLWLSKAEATIFLRFVKKLAYRHANLERLIEDLLGEDATSHK